MGKFQSSLTRDEEMDHGQYAGFLVLIPIAVVAVLAYSLWSYFQSG